MATLYLRNQENQTLVDIELYSRDYIVNDLRSVVNIIPYSVMLIKYHPHSTVSIMMNFHALSELRMWFHEVNIKSKNVKGTIGDIKTMFEEFVSNYDLKWVED